jgi:hypothetical protein
MHDYQSIPGATFVDWLCCARILIGALLLTSCSESESADEPQQRLEPPLENGLIEIFKNEKVYLVHENGESDTHILFRHGSMVESGVMTDSVSISENESTVEFTIEAGLDSTVRVMSNPKTGKRALVMFLSGGDLSKVIYDLNMDGVWDARKSVKSGSEIFFDNGWLRVENLKDLPENPSATTEGTSFTFSAQWEKILKK